MRIKVTQADIDKGRRYSAWESPLSYAFKRAFNSRKAFVGATICLVWRGKPTAFKLWMRAPQSFSTLNDYETMS